MVKLLHYWLSRLTLFCLLAFAAGGVAKAADLTVHCQIEGEWSANIWTLDATGFPMVGTPLVNGKDVVIKDVITLFGNLPITLDSFTGTLTDVLVDGVSNDDAMFQYNKSSFFHTTHLFLNLLSNINDFLFSIKPNHNNIKLPVSQ